MSHALNSPNVPPISATCRIVPIYPNNSEFKIIGAINATSDLWPDPIHGSFVIITSPWIKSVFLKVLDIEVPGLTFPKAKAPKVEKLANEEEVDKAPTKKKVVKKKTATKAKE